MSTTQGNFKVKHGLSVGEDATITGNLVATVGSDDSHVVTKGYVKDLTFAVVSDTAPSTPHPGKMWIDSTESRLKVYTGSSWVTVASKADTDRLADHIHDDAIDGTGQIIEVF